MKKGIILIALCLVLMSFGMAQALPIYQINDVAGRIGNGGPFQVIGNGYDYLTMCVEKLESLSLGSSYYGSIDPVVVYGSGDVNNSDPLNANTETLYEYFLDNIASLTNEQKADIQVAIWAFQGETGAPTGNDYFDDPENYIGTDRNIMVLNLWTADVTYPYIGDASDYMYRRQSLLIPVVPEPSLLILLGIGLVGVAGARRMFKS